MSAAFQVSEVTEILALMEHWGIAEVHLTVDDAALDLVRATQTAPAVEPVPLSMATTPAPTPEVGMPLQEPVVIYAPVVGVFHLTHRGFPQGIPQVGDTVQTGQVIGSIELMHIPTDLISPTTGTIEVIRVEEGAGVEYGQPLMVIQPLEEVSENETGIVPPSSR